MAVTNATATPAANCVVKADSAGHISISWIADNSVTLAKLATQANNTILGNKSGATAAPSALSASDVRIILGLATTDSPTFTGAVLTNMGIFASAINTNYGIYGSKSIIDPITTGQVGAAYLRQDSIYTSSVTQYTNVGNFVSHPLVATGIIQSGYVRGLLLEAMRNYNGVSSDDGGTLSGLYGNAVVYGHYNINTSAAPITTACYGIVLAPYCKTGTITTLYDLSIESPSSGGTVTNHYAIYQAYASAKNYFAGNMGIGVTGFGTSATRTLALASGTAPGSSPADMVQLYSADFGGTAGKATLHIRTEEGHVIGLARQSHISDPTTDTTSLQTAVKAILTALETLGLLATS